jgi:conjugative relaxase-like TrwC/TraI family protein
MLRINPIKNSKSAKEYYTNALEKGDYYIKDVVLENYKGELAKMLGLDKVQVSKENFCKLADNINPLTGEKITMGGDRIDRKPMYDFTFSCPKSVSILYALTEDQELQANILRVFNESVDYTMQEAEKMYSLTRDQSNGKNEYIQTGNIVYAGFGHETSRPVDGIPYPHLHKHCTVMNMTYDPVSGKYKAVEFLDFKTYAEFIQTIFESEFAHRLQIELDLACVNKDYNNYKSFELAGYTDEMIAGFSPRTALIEDEAKKKSITDPKKIAELGKKTREGKKEIKEKAVVVKTWRDKLNEYLGLNNLVITPIKNSSSHAKEKYKIGKLSIESGLRHYIQYESTPSKDKLLNYSIRNNLSGQNLKSIKKIYSKAIAQENMIEGKIGRKDVITTKGIINEEQRIINLVNAGLTGSNPINKNAKANPNLTAEQAKVFEGIMKSEASINYIRGDAGTGKTYTINKLQNGAKEAGYSFQVYAPTSIAGRVVLREEVTKNANTLQTFLLSEGLQRSANNKTVVVVDEAGTIGNENMLKLLELQKINKFILILVGDTKQNPPVERGEPLKMIEEKTAIAPLTLTKNYRQNGNLDYQEAINHFAKHDVKSGLEKLEKMGAIIEIPNATKRNTLIAKDYVSEIKKSRDFEQGLKENLVVIPTHAEACKVTKKIREELKKEKIIGKGNSQDIDYSILRDRELSTEQKRDYRNYEKGDTIMFTNNHKDGIVKGSEWSLKWNKQEEKYNLISLDSNQKLIIKDLPIDAPDKFNVMTKDTIKLTTGDQILLTAGVTSQQKREIPNKSRYIIDKIDIDKKTGDKTITLDNGYVLPANHKSINYGYTSTSYSSQGITAKNVIATHIQDSKGAISYQESYVKLSRGKQFIKLYTDNIAKMYNSIAQIRQKAFGLDVVKSNNQLAKQDKGQEKVLTK